MSTATNPLPPLTLVVMGVSGVGKTSNAQALVAETHWVFQEGDGLYPAANVAKMAAGHPLDDNGRWPWLRRVSEWIGIQESAGRGAVVTCSALKRVYRDLIRDGHPSVRLVHLTASEEVLRDRVTHRQGHYMPPSLLHSQLDVLEPLGQDELGVKVEMVGQPQVVAARALEALCALEVTLGPGYFPHGVTKFVQLLDLLNHLPPSVHSSMPPPPPPTTLYMYKHTVPMDQPLRSFSRPPRYRSLPRDC